MQGISLSDVEQLEIINNMSIALKLWFHEWHFLDSQYCPVQPFGSPISLYMIA